KDNAVIVAAELERLSVIGAAILINGGRRVAAGLDRPRHIVGGVLVDSDPARAIVDASGANNDRMGLTTDGHNPGNATAYRIGEACARGHHRCGNKGNLNLAHDAFL